MAPDRRFNLYTRCQLDFPAVRSGRVLDRVRLLGLPEAQLFICALDSGLLAAAPKLASIHIDFLASDREALVDCRKEGRAGVLAAVRFDATGALDASDREIQWRIHRAGLLALLAVAAMKSPGHAAEARLRTALAESPSADFPAFPAPSQAQWDLFHDYALYSAGRRSGLLTVELAAPPGSDAGFDFQPVFNQLTDALAGARLGTWRGDSGNDIEFACRDLAAAKARVEETLAGGYAGSFRIGVLED